MRKAKLRATRITDAELVVRATTTKEALTKNAAAFPKAAQMIAELEAVLTPFAEATRKVADAKMELRGRVSRKNACRKSLEQVWRSVADGVDFHARGDAELIHAAGFPVTNDPQPVRMTQGQSLTVTPGKNEGQLLARWKPVRRAAGYVVQVCAEKRPVSDKWITHSHSTKAQCRLNHSLETGQQVWVRVCAFGARNTGAWSDPVRQTVP